MKSLIIAVAVIAAVVTSGTVIGLLFWAACIAAFLCGRQWEKTSARIGRMADPSVPFTATEPDSNVRRYL